MLPLELAAAAVAALAPYLSIAASEAAKKLGSAAAERLESLHARIKSRLTSPAAQEVLAAVEKTPEDPDAQGALRLALKRLLVEDPVFHSELAAQVEELRSMSPTGIAQISTMTGDSNVNVQISGSSNQVLGRTD